MGLVPSRLLALRGLTDSLKAISVADGYSQDINGAVFRGRAFFGENDPLPMLSILQDPRLFEWLMGPAATDVRKGEWRGIIQGFVQDDFENPTDPAEYLLADTVMALARARDGVLRRNLFGLGSKRLTDLTWGVGIVRPPDEISMNAYFWLPVTIHMVEDDSAPFTSI